jgi:hypothetical protein
MTYNITQHCKERYIERVLGGLNNSPNIFIEMIRKLNAAKNITSQLSEEVPRFILYIKERYGADRGYTFLKNDNFIYVLIKRKGTKKVYDVITCYDRTEDLEKYKKTVLTNEQLYLKLKQLKTK